MYDNTDKPIASTQGGITPVSRPVWLATRSYGVCRQVDIDWSTRTVIVVLQGREHRLAFAEVIKPFADDVPHHTWQWPGEVGQGGCSLDEVLDTVFYRLESLGFTPNSSLDTSHAAYRGMAQVLTAWGVTPIAFGEAYIDDENTLE